INNAPFAGDTLASGSELQLDMGITQLFKGSGDPIQVNEVKLNDAFINIKVDTLGNANYDITKTDSLATTNDKPIATTEDGDGFQFDVQHYELNNSRINYLEESTKTFLRLTEVNHSGTGDFSADVSTLETETTALASFDLDGVNYLNANKLQLTADIEMDLKNQKYTFKDNEAMINQLPLVFQGYVQINENNNDIDLSFKTPSSDFKNFLAVIPEEYAKNLDGVTTTGDFRVSGIIKGIVDETHIPTLDISISSNNASFKYPDLPKAVEDIIIDAQIKNETGIVDDTYLRLGNVTFRIDQDKFAASGRIDRLTTNPLVDLALKGRLNLANLEKAYPLELDQDLNGILVVDMTTNFDMQSVEKEQYQNIKSSGMANLTNFKYTSPELPNALTLSEAAVKFNTSTITLEKLQGQTGETDLAATGSIQNLIPFLLSKQDLKGRFSVKSNTINLADFSVAETTKTPVEEDGKTKEKEAVVANSEAIKIPSFLDAGIDFSAGKVIYDNITLTNVKGNILIADETATLSNVTSNVFGGNIAIDGNVSTKGVKPTFAMKLDLKSIDIGQSFAGMDLLQGIAPIAQALQGKLNTDIQLKGNLSDDFTPVLSSLAGNALAELLTAKVNPDKMALLNTLDSKLDFINLKDINLNDLKTQLSFDNGNVVVKPFDFDVKGIKVNVSGSHSLENIMNYNLTLDVPARLLGSKIGGALASLSATDLDKYTVDLPISLTGSFSSPQVGINTQMAVNNLTQQIIATQKDKLKEEGTNKIKDALGGILGNATGNKTTTDTTATAQKADTTTTKKEVQDAVKGILGGILGKKKKVDTTKTNN
ncbi:MAG: AsmA-like C-terminal region-containing protein, partial [Leeuwenhoekiella sp.]